MVQAWVAHFVTPLKCTYDDTTDEYYSLRIAPAAIRASINTTIMQHVPTLLAVSMAITMQRYYTVRIAQWKR